MSDTARRSIAILRERLAARSAATDHALTVTLPALEPRRWMTAGVGASEGPARLLAALLRDGGIEAEYVPLSAFFDATSLTGDGLVVFSQSVSPNARLAFRARVASACVVTALPADHTLVASLRRRSIEVVHHLPADEDGLLIRVAGPAAASVIAARLAAQIASRAHSTPVWAPLIVSAAARVHATSAPRASHPRVLIVGAAGDIDVAEGLRLKLVEGLGVAAAVSDICSLVHGPLQSFWNEPATLVTLECDDDPARDMFERLATIAQRRHQLVRLRSSLPRPLAYIEHAARIDEIVLATLDERPRDLAVWPGDGVDMVLYDVGHDEL